MKRFSFLSLYLGQLHQDEPELSKDGMVEKATKEVTALLDTINEADEDALDEWVDRTVAHAKGVKK